MPFEEILETANALNETYRETVLSYRCTKCGLIMLPSEVKRANGVCQLCGGEVKA
jgi:DNA-directed RNA polymerase subunit RPC12/RpoP